jgi:hypothetical protein
MASSQKSRIAWTPREIRGLVVVTTGCLLLTILILGTMFGILTGRIDSNLIGSASKAGVGIGILGIMGICYKVIRLGMGRKEEVVSGE